MRGKGTAERIRRRLLPALLLAALIGAWQLAAATGALADVLGLESFLVPSPAEIGESLWQNRSLLADNAWVTLREIFFGFLISVVAGIGFAVVLHLWTTVRMASYPLLIASQTIPILALAPIFVVWFGYGIGPKLAIIALVCFFPITVTTLDGLRSVNPEMTKLMRTLDASRWQTLRRVEAPTALPYTFSGARLAAVFTTIAALFGEWAGSSAGLGHLILQDNGQLETARMFAAFIILSAIALVLYGLLALAERRVVTWR
jgi:NitT/TauT family transport system permease protein/putative hydroxymethylpyrimidine transport system permease protein